VLVPIGRSEKLVVPAAAVVRRSELTAVYVLGEGGARQLRQVRVGNRVSDDAVEVLAGLSAGERVALDPLRGSGAI
jgi:hypothetical protein